LKRSENPICRRRLPPTNPLCPINAFFMKSLGDGTVGARHAVPLRYGL